MSNFNWIDLLFCGVALISVLIGLWRGLVFEVLSLIAWVVAWWLAQWFSPTLAPFLPIGQPGSSVNLGVALAVSFVLALMLWALLARLVRLLVQSTPLLSGVDRLLGAVFGGARALVLLLVLTMVVLLMPLKNSAAWRESLAVPWLVATVQGLKPLLPSALSDKLP
jgi:membrane protein required for colicin V production